jgi:hypothetical protein
MKRLEDEFSIATHTGQRNGAAAGHRGQPFPNGTPATIRRLPRSVTSSAPQAHRPWILAFERNRPQRIEPLMGWTSDEDPMVQVRLSFPSHDAAVAYAERQGLAYRIHDEPAPRSAGQESFERVVWGNAVMNAATQHGQDLPKGLDRAMINPASVFGSPDEVVSHPSLGIGQKWEILRRWAWDEYLLDVAAQEAMPAPETASRLDEVKTAMLRLEEFARLAFAAGGMASVSHEPDGRQG